MRNILTVLVVLTCQAFAADWTVIEGGISPDKKLAVAVMPLNPKSDDEPDHVVVLVDQARGERVDLLDDVSTSGGTWGKPETNVRCEWSEDSTVLLVNYRAGRLMQSTQLYRIQKQRALPLTLPAADAHPKGKILKNVGHTTNPGCEVSVGKDGTIIQRCWGYFPDFSIDYSKHGLKDFGDTLLFHYRFDKEGNLKLEDIVVPPIVK